MRFITMFSCVLSSFLFGQPQPKGQCMATHRVLVIVPAVHQALKMIENGISENWKGPEKIVAFNSNGDNAQMQSIINSISGNLDDVAAVIPIGYGAMQQTMKALENRVPIIGAAADVELRKEDNACTIVDGLNSVHQVKALRAMLPKAKHLTLLIANVEKSLKTAAEFETAARAHGFTVHIIPVDNLADINFKVTPSSISHDTSALILLKDHLTVSAIPQLLKVCNHLNIVLATSDEGSVIAGAHMAVGMSEYDIGKRAAEVGARVVGGGEAASDIGRVEPGAADLVVYLNTQWSQKIQSVCGSPVSIDSLKKSGMKVEMR